MTAKDGSGRPEREDTDTSLRAERDKTDEELQRRASAIAAESDAEVEAARLRARIVLESARARADEKLDDEDDGRAQRAVAAERRTDDATLASEYRVSDSKRHAERDRRERALLRVLELERSETDRTLTSERARADQVVATRDDFLGMVSHDLRTMLGGIAMNAAMIVDQAARDEQRAYLKRGDSIQRFTARMNRLIGDLLDIVSIEAGQLGVIAAPDDACQLVRETLEVFQLVAAQRGITLDGDADRAALLGRFDHDRILQVLGNLVSNAIKFTPVGGRVSIRVERAPGGGPDGDDAVMFTVSDTGVGVAEADLEAIFARFRQVQRSDRLGLGLGLYISRCIVEAHGGRIWAESTQGQGSTFHFTLPAAA